MVDPDDPVVIDASTGQPLTPLPGNALTEQFHGLARRAQTLGDAAQMMGVAPDHARQWATLGLGAWLLWQGLQAINRGRHGD